MKLHLMASLGFAVATAVIAASGCSSETGAPGEDTAAADEAFYRGHGLIAKAVNPAQELAAQDLIARLPAAKIAPDYFWFGGGNVHLTYARLGDVAVMTFVEGDQAHTFLGNELHTTITPMGTMVTVYLEQRLALGYKTFSLLVPRVVLPTKGLLGVESQGIIAGHESAVFPSKTPRQLDHFEVTTLQGIAGHGPIIATDVEAITRPAPWHEDPRAE